MARTKQSTSKQSVSKKRSPEKKKANEIASSVADKLMRSQTKESATQATCTVLQINAHLYGKNYKSTVAELLSGKRLEYKDSERKAELIRLLRESTADIVSLEEIWDNYIAEEIVIALSSKYPYSSRVNNDSYLSVGNGLLLLSKYQLTNSKFIKFRDLKGPDAHANKGFLMNCIQITESKRVAMCITHTQASYIGNPFAMERKKNIIQMIASFSTYIKICNAPYVVVAGDLNFPAHQMEEYSKICSLFEETLALKDCFPDHLYPGYTYDSTKNGLIKIFAPDDVGYRLQKRLDYFFVSSNLKCEDYTIFDTLDISDHYAVCASFNFINYDE